MTDVEGARSFQVSSEGYDRFMGRYSRLLAAGFADVGGVAPGLRVLDVGCGPGALTAELVRRTGVEHVAAIDPSPPFVAACARTWPGLDVRQGQAEHLPHPDASFDAALAQLVFHFLGDPRAGALEMRRVVRPGGAVAACVWDLGDGMRMLRLFWDAALAVVPSAPDEAQNLRFGRDGELADLFVEAGLREVGSGALTVELAYAGFDDLWTPFLGGPGPACAFYASLDAARQERVRDEFRRRVGAPEGAFTLPARAWYAVGRV